MSRTSHPGQNPYSQLEIVPDRLATYPQHAAAREPYSKLEVDASHPDAKYLSTATVASANANSKNQEASERLKRRRKWILRLSLVGLIVVGAVLGGVLGTVLSKNHSSSPPQAVTGYGYSYYVFFISRCSRAKNTDL